MFGRCWIRNVYYKRKTVENFDLQKANRKMVKDACKDKDKEKSDSKPNEEFCPTLEYCSRCDLCQKEVCHPIKPSFLVTCIPWFFGIFVVILAAITLFIAGLLVSINLEWVTFPTPPPPTIPIIALPNPFPMIPIGHGMDVEAPIPDFTSNEKQPYTFVTTKLNLSDANEFCQSLNMRLAFPENPDDEDALLDSANKQTNEECNRQYLTGYRMSLDFSWHSSDNTPLFGSLLSDMWVAQDDVLPNNTCAAMIKEEDFRLKRISCDLESVQNSCYICETSVGCPSGSTLPCYDSFADPLFIADEGNNKCKEQMEEGKLAVPVSRIVWSRMKEAHLASATNEICEVVLVDAVLEPLYESVSGEGDFYSMQEVDFSHSSTKDICLAAGDFKGYVMTACDQPECFICRE